MSVEALSSDKDSGSDSQNDLCKIPALPAPADFLSAAGAAMPKLMTPDAFMTPSASVSDGLRRMGPDHSTAARRVQRCLIVPLAPS